MLTGVGVGLYIASWVIVGTRGWVDMGTIETIVLAHLWIVTMAVSFGTAYLFRRSMVERICTWRGRPSSSSGWLPHREPLSEPEPG